MYILPQKRLFIIYLYQVLLVWGIIQDKNNFDCRLVESMIGHTDTISCMSYSKSNNVIVSGSEVDLQLSRKFT
jgi:hypothetical protein